MKLTRRTLVWSGSVAALGVATSCVRVPTSGPVEPVAPNQPASEGPQIVSRPKPPIAGDTPLGIVYGFLAAMQGSEPGYETARQYLTPEASRTWNPTVGATIYESEDHPVVSTPDSATLRAPVIGTLDSKGYFRATNVVFGSSDQPYDFALTQVATESGSQWRIGNPPAGLLISRLTFETYASIGVQFLTPDVPQAPAGVRMVPEPCYLPEGQATPAVVAKVLFAGPSEWLAPAVATAIPAGGGASLRSVVVDQGVATLAISAPVTALTGVQRTWLGAQVLWTLTQFPQVTGVRFSANQQAWAVDDEQDADGVLRGYAVTQYLSTPPSPPTTLIAVRAGVAGTYGAGDSEEFRAFGGALGQANNQLAPGKLAANRTTDGALDRLAFVNDKGTAVYLTTPDGDQNRKVVEGDQLTRPQFLDDTVWVTGRTKAGKRSMFVISASDEVRPLALPDEMSSHRIQAFRISPDRTRIAVVAGDQGQYLGMLRLRTGTSPLIDGWLPLPLSGRKAIPLIKFLDVGWVNGQTLLVLGSGAADQTAGAYLVSVDGARIQAYGSPPFAADPVRLMSAPTRSEPYALALGREGTPYRLNSGATNWTPLNPTLTDIACPDS